MRSRLRMSGLHLCASACALLLVLGVLYFGWYRWPGWYLTGVVGLLPVIVGVDLVLGPLMTFVIANPKKSARELARDIAFIAVVQLVALCYGATALWSGRPLFYTYTMGALSVTQGVDLLPKQIALARKSNPEYVPHWYSLPRWVWAPLPKDPKANSDILFSAVSGGPDVTAMPVYFKPWTESSKEVRSMLKKVGDEGNYFSPAERDRLTRRMQARGLDPNAVDTLPMTGGRKSDTRLLAVLDPETLRLKAFLQAN